MGEELAIVGDAFEKEVRDALEESMAKDTTIGPVSKPEGGHYESSEDIRMANKELPQTEVANAFDKDIAAMLIEGGYYSLFQLAHASDGVLMELKGVGLEELAVVREKAPYESSIPTLEAEIEVEVEEGADKRQAPDAVVDGQLIRGQTIYVDDPEEELPELAHLEVGPVEPVAPVEPPKFGADMILEVFGDKIGTLLIESGYASVRGVAAADDKELVAIKGIGQGTLRKIRALNVYLPATAPAPVADGPPVSERVRRSMESAESQ